MTEKFVPEFPSDSKIQKVFAVIRRCKGAFMSSARIAEAAHTGRSYTATVLRAAEKDGILESIEFYGEGMKEGTGCSASRAYRFVQEARP